MSPVKPNITRDDLKALRKFLRAKCPTLKVQAGKGKWWRLTHINGSGKDWKFTEEEIQFLSQIGLIEIGTYYTSINMIQAEKILEEVIKHDHS